MRHFNFIAASLSVFAAINAVFFLFSSLKQIHVTLPKEMIVKLKGITTTVIFSG